MKVLIANRGEIAIRVMRTLKELGLSSVAVYSEEDRDSPHVGMADEAWCIGSAAPRESYLNINRMITAAKIAGADLVHPGYGFLSENDQFALACEEAGLKFIGPKGSVMAGLANKFATKELVAKAGVPVIPGSQRPLRGVEEAKSEAKVLGYPVLLKAAFGGGGRGIVLVHDESAMEKAFGMSQMEAQAAFGKSELYMEKCLLDARHVEVQVAADHHGAVRSYTERDCTIQRRNQKLIEESPSPFISQEARPRLLEAGAKATAACRLTALATVEFLLLPDRKTFYFMEINKRIQVEHPVTEELLGLDLIRLQVGLALGEKLGPAIEAPPGRHAIEVRVNAEDAAQNFLSGEGTITALHWPAGPGVRVDTFIRPYLTLATSYDSLLAKVIASSGHGRPGAISRMRRALTETTIEGIPTTIPFHKKILADPVFAQGKEWFNVKYLDSWIPKQRFI
ncbi:MAG: ATP-grasp domain-containing protein [Elusimicrobia bacterium]|nr:ATP-grasp domain-containing protein [Elusimicrobiota bacterium]